MKPQNITIDINRLDADQLKQLSKMFWETQPAPATIVKAINDREAFVSGRMSEEKEAEYLKRYC